MTKIDIENHLKTFIDPHYGIDLITAKAIKNIEIDGTNVHVNVELGYAAQSYLETLKNELTDLLKSFPEIGEISVNARVKIA
ncbi:MAG: iron-sulfur cluster carrier protein ApbC, partial [Pseudomonadota bacterium]